jgi:anti-anti-sigma factor
VLTTERRSVQDAIVLALHGDLDYSTAERARAAIEEAEAERPAVLVLDLRGLGFFDSTGLRLVIKAGSKAAMDGRRLAVVPGELAEEMLRTVKADELFEVVASPEEALG